MEIRTDRKTAENAEAPTIARRENTLEALEALEAFSALGALLGLTRSRPQSSSSPYVSASGEYYNKRHRLAGGNPRRLPAGAQ